MLLNDDSARHVRVQHAGICELAFLPRREEQFLGFIPFQVFRSLYAEGANGEAM